ncbi:aminoglycoside adenylyltransferase family protein [Streptomyces lancefieldiae]|uniref:Aminoglycoside adenylyltransferase family protein n=1 Tax=Streptomyces lancefieldiae TaxID=3075520 RepID=A0ABU3AVC3_9ACTN|nr:aminoglycoside adenylyltransferase family protein [Streptomyces sp. DSM 40712]MDT0613775.1 aminoglycoside adenylyltransferase family protein [Streptomyces sp. DSM 40712]
MPDRDRDRTDHLVALVRRHLGDHDVLGVYAHGSATLGGLRPHSDLDLLVVVRDRTTHGRRARLTEELLKVSGGEGHRPVELIVVVRDDVRPWRYPPRRDYLYGEWLRDAYERGHVPEPEGDPDLAPLLTMVLRADAPLYGPPPAALLDPVPHEDLRRAIVAGVPGLMAELESDTRNVLLTLARIWSTLATGEIRSKDAAADWALARLPVAHRPPMAHARAVYLGQEEERRGDGVRPCAEHLVRAVRTAYAEAE